jgi:hypothetical protein
MMSRQQKLIYLPLVGAILLCLLAIMYMMARKRTSKSNPSDAISKHSVDTSPEKALKYWTADKMRQAKAAEMPNVSTPGRRKKQHKQPSQAPQPPDA